MPNISKMNIVNYSIVNSTSSVSYNSFVRSSGSRVTNGDIVSNFCNGVCDISIVSNVSTVGNVSMVK